MIRTIAIDDEPLALKVIENFCSKTASIDLKKVFTHPAEALRHLNNFPTDLIFIDIQMPLMTGIEFYRQVEQGVMAIFTTAYSEYGVEGFNLNALDYLLKPFSFERFQQAVNKAEEYCAIQQQAEKDYIYVRADYSLIKINISDILFIEGLGDYLKIYIHGQKTVVARMTMKEMTQNLPAQKFVRVHRSFIIPFKRIDYLRNKSIFIGGKEIPIGNSYEAHFLSVLGNKQ